MASDAPPHRDVTPRAPGDDIDLRAPRDDITLRAPRDDDARMHAALTVSPEIHQMYGGAPDHLPVRSLRASQDWVAWLRTQPFGRIIEANGAPVGEIRFHTLSPDRCHAWLAVGLFCESFLNRRIGRRAVRLALEHGRDKMGLAAVSLRVLSFNTRAIRCYEACGFRTVGTEEVTLPGVLGPQKDILMRTDFFAEKPNG